MAIETALMISLDLSAVSGTQEKVVEVVKEVPVEVIKEVPMEVDTDRVIELQNKLTATNAQLEILQKMYSDLLVKAMK